MTTADLEPTPAPGRPLRIILVGVVAILATTLLATLLSATPPLHITCDPRLDAKVCRDTVTAAQERGLARSHPLIVDAAVAPGEVPQPGRVGHRATVTFDLLGVPSLTTVRLYYDIGAHWGGVTSRSATELGSWAVLVAALLVGAVCLLIVGVSRLLRQRREERQAA